MGILDGKVAVITGGTRGLGFGIAQSFARNGAAVVLASRSQASVDSAIEKIQIGGGKAAGLAVDVADLKAVEALAGAAIAAYGRIDIWVNNAGTAGPYGPTMGFTPDAFYQVVNTNVLGIYNGSRTALKYFIAQGSGKLINVLGHGYNGPVAWQNAYGASKAWVRSFTMALAKETKGSGVGIYAFNPGMVLTELLTDVDVIEGSEEKLKNFPTIVRMWAKPVELSANKAVWIASSATDGKTGLLVNIFTPWLMIKGAVQEGLRSLLKRPVEPTPVRIKTIPPDKG